jgi:hypothetical protein
MPYMKAKKYTKAPVKKEEPSETGSNDDDASSGGDNEPTEIKAIPAPIAEKTEKRTYSQNDFVFDAN